MATLSAIQAALVAKVIAELSPTLELEGPASRMALLAPGATAVMALGLVAGIDRRQSNTAYGIGHLTLEILHRLASPGSSAAESAYLKGAAQADQLSLVDPVFWQVADVHEVLELGELVLRERVGHVIAYTVDATLNYVPS
jgi:hypothetical protein